MQRSQRDHSCVSLAERLLSSGGIPASSAAPSSDADDDDDDEDDEDDDEDEVLVVDLEGKRAALMEGTSSMRRSVSVKC